MCVRKNCITAIYALFAETNLAKKGMIMLYQLCVLQIIFAFDLKSTACPSGVTIVQACHSGWMDVQIQFKTSPTIQRVASPREGRFETRALRRFPLALQPVISTMLCKPFFVMLFAFVASTPHIYKAPRSLVVPSLTEHLFPFSSTSSTFSTQPFLSPRSTFNPIQKTRRSLTARRSNLPNLRTQSYRMKKFRMKLELIRLL